MSLSSIVIEWCLRNPDRVFYGVAGVAVAIARQVPASTYAKWAKRWPWAEKAYRVLRKAGPDIVGAIRAAAAKPDNALPPSLLDVPRAVEPSAMHHRPTMPSPPPMPPENDS